MQLTNEKKKPIASIVFFMIATVYLAYDIFYALPDVNDRFLGYYTANLFNLIMQKLIFLFLEILLIVALFKNIKDRFLASAICLVPLFRIIFGLLMGENGYFQEVFYADFVLSFFSLAFQSTKNITLFIIAIFVFYNKKNLIKKIWYIPGVAGIVNAIMEFIGIFIVHIENFERPWFTFLFLLIESIAILLLGYWLKPIEEIKMQAKIEEKAEPKVSGKPGGEIDKEDSSAYCSLGLHIVLCLFTFGIWTYIWTYRTTKFCNKAKNTVWQNPTTKLLLCMLVPFYQIYWFYKQGQRLDLIARDKQDYHSDMATLCLILGIFIPIIAVIIMQDRINSFCVKTAYQKENKVEVKNEKSDEEKKLESLMALLEKGIITQEDFDAKKKQILGL